jgi:putative transcriptional regulator
MGTTNTTTNAGQKKSSMDLTGHFLIAMPHIQSDLFERSVVYICEHTEAGALGLVINRSADVRISEILDKLAAEDGIEYAHKPVIDKAVLMGGPVQTERGFVLHTPYREYAATIKINDQLGLTSSRDVLEEWAQGTGPEHMILALGYAGWGAGQLEEEISQNAWLSTPADAHVLFETLPAEKYTQAVRLLGFGEEMLSNAAGHA